MSEGPVVLRTMRPHTRDSALYWRSMPTDHNASGLFAGGPQEARPWWFEEVRTGNAHRATESRLAALQRMEEEQRRKLAALERRKRFLEMIQSPTPAPKRRRFR